MTLELEIPIRPSLAPVKLLPVFDGKYDEKVTINFFREFLSDRCEVVTSENKWAYQLRIFWYPEENLSSLQPPWNSIQHRIKVFLLSFENLMPDYWGKTAFVQFWEPVTTEDGRRILSVLKQPFAARQYLKGLCRFRYYCEKLCRIGCRTEVGNNFGPVGRAFTRGSLEFSPHVDIYSYKDFPLKNHAKHCGVAGYLALPIFELGGEYVDGKQPPCVGVLEFISFTANVLTSFDTGICMKKLKEVGLAFRYPSHSEALTQIRPYFNFPSRKGKPEEIISVLDTVRKAYNLPLIQVWLPCICYGSEVFVTCEPYGGNSSKITHLVCGLQSVNDRRSSWLSSYGACDSEVYFVENGESWVGRAYSLKKIRFVKDIGQYSIANYPLVNLCYSTDLSACFAVPLQLVNPKLPPLVLEIFLPPLLNFVGDPKDIINPVLSMVARELSKYYVNSGLRQDYIQNRGYQPPDATRTKEIEIERPYIAPCHEPLGNGCHSDDRRKTPAKLKPWLTYVRRKNKLVHCGVPAVEDDHAQQHKPNDAIEIKERQISTQENMRPSTVPCHEPLVDRSTLKRGIKIKEGQVSGEENITVPGHEPLAGQSTIMCQRGMSHKRPAQQIPELQNNSDGADQQSEKRFCPTDNSTEKQDEAATVSIPVLIEFPVATYGRVASIGRRNNVVDQGPSIPSTGQSTIMCQRGMSHKRPAQQIPELQNNSDGADQQSEKRFCPTDNSTEKQDEAAIEFPVAAYGRVASIGRRNNVVDQGPSIPSSTVPCHKPLAGQSTIKRQRGRPRKIPAQQIPELQNNSDDADQHLKLALDGRVASIGLRNNVVDQGPFIPSTTVPCHEPLAGQSTIMRQRGRPRKIPTQRIPELQNNYDDADKQSEKRFCPSDNSKEKQDEAASISIPIPREFPVAADGRVASIGLGNNVVDQGPSIPSTTGKSKNTKPENDKVDHGTTIGKGRNDVPENNEIDNNCSTIVKAATVSIPTSVEIPIATDGRVAGTGLGVNVVDHGLSIPSTDGKDKNTKADHNTSIPTNEKGRNNVPEINQADHNFSTLVMAAMVASPIPIRIPVTTDERVASTGLGNNPASTDERVASIGLGNNPATTDERVASIGLGNNVVDQGPCISPVPHTTGKGKNTNPENDGVDHGIFIPANGKGRNNVPENGEVDHNCSLIVKARYKDDIVKFPLSSSSGIEGLRGELLKRFELEVGRFKIKYPEAGDWFLLSCSEDLSFHMRSLASAGQTILELSIFSTT